MLDVSGLTKYYGVTAAVRDVSFVVEPGEVLGYLGPNGWASRRPSRCSSA